MYKPEYTSLYITITCIRDRPINFLGAGAVCFALQARHVILRETNVRLLIFRHTKSVFFSSNYNKPFRSKLWVRLSIFCIFKDNLEYIYN